MKEKFKATIIDATVVIDNDILEKMESIGGINSLLTDDFDIGVVNGCIGDFSPYVSKEYGRTLSFEYDHYPSEDDIVSSVEDLIFNEPKYYGGRNSSFFGLTSLRRLYKLKLFNVAIEKL